MYHITFMCCMFFCIIGVTLNALPESKLYTYICIHSIIKYYTRCKVEVTSVMYTL